MRHRVPEVSEVSENIRNLKCDIAFEVSEIVRTSRTSNLIAVPPREFRGRRFHSGAAVDFPGRGSGGQGASSEPRRALRPGDTGVFRIQPVGFLGEVNPHHPFVTRSGVHKF